MLDWLQNPYAVIALAIGAMFFGYFFGLIEGRGQGYKRRKKEEAQEEEKVEPQAPVEPAPPVDPVLPPVLPPDEQPMLAVSMDTVGSLRLKLDGQRVEDPPLDPEQRKRLIAVLTLVRPWLEAVTPAPGPARPAPTHSTPVRSAPAPEPRPASPPAKEGEEATEAPQSIVAQIDSILQTQLAGTPLMEKGIRLHESLEGGVVVWVGIKKYEGIEDVPDEQIKGAIRAAITTWENKYTPGI